MKPTFNIFYMRDAAHLQNAYDDMSKRTSLVSHLKTFMLHQNPLTDSSNGYIYAASLTFKFT